MSKPGLGCYAPRGERPLASRLSKSPSLRESPNAALVISERLAQHFLGVRTEQGRRHGIDTRRHTHVDLGFNVRHESGSWVRNTAEAVSLACLRGVEPLLDRAEIADGYIGLPHL